MYEDITNLIKHSKIQIVPPEVVSEVIGYRQARVHRNKRINKKWRKRYGYVPVYDYTKIILMNDIYQEHLKKENSK